MSGSRFRRVTVVLLLAACPALSGWQAVGQAGTAEPRVRCTPRDERLAELSGLAAGPRHWFAVGDGGSAVRVYELDPGDCSVVGVRSADVDPYDVEDLARRADGTLWLADTGDNSSRRDTVAVHVLEPSGAVELHRLKYPDGPRDAEALLLGRDGVPHIVTKHPWGEAGIYRPVAALDGRGPVELERVGTLSLEPTDTPGGPLPASFGSVVVTGGAVSSRHDVVAVRTYTDAYLYPAPDGDVVEALRRDPVRVPLPNEPQGEAIAFEPDGDMLTASEKLAPVRAVENAVSSVAARAEDTVITTSSADRPVSSSERWFPPTRRVLLGLGGVAVVTSLLLLGGVRRRARRRR
ncbi:hypothetical protein SAMN04487905_10590 [Actinopolyspora xinjiangensis]|uniref:Esterase-like activity of phytase n=1 Tax=Actinopolyspora xinjiangensis TaxID=405564 RepID=A0A1H0TJF7_9ACTN|nr:hypothetical protein [Actinopolyspora xinjiangensis]SDP53718.1 hypothetical protein SAMN04487905_10590 [Actinopolyspora xinjiangensis]